MQITTPCEFLCATLSVFNHLFHRLSVSTVSLFEWNILVLILSDTSKGSSPGNAHGKIMPIDLQPKH